MQYVQQAAINPNNLSKHLFRVPFCFYNSTDQTKQEVHLHNVLRRTKATSISLIMVQHPALAQLMCFHPTEILSQRVIQFYNVEVKLIG